MSEHIKNHVLKVTSKYGVSRHIVERSIMSLVNRGYSETRAMNVTIRQIVADYNRINAN